MNNFTDAQMMADQHSDTFEVPDSHALKHLQPGMLVKVCAENERFWCIIKGISGQEVTAIIDNDLVSTDLHGLKYGDEIIFETRHIYQI